MAHVWRRVTLAQSGASLHGPLSSPKYRLWRCDRCGRTVGTQSLEAPPGDYPGRGAPSCEGQVVIDVQDS